MSRFNPIGYFSSYWSFPPQETAPQEAPSQRYRTDSFEAANELPGQAPQPAASPWDDMFEWTQAQWAQHGDTAAQSLAYAFYVASRGDRAWTAKDSVRKPFVGIPYDTFMQTRQNARSSDDFLDRFSFFQQFNSQVSPHLRTEECALQLLAQKIAYHRLAPASAAEPYWFNFNICKNFREEIITRYAKHYFVREEIVDNAGVVAHLLEPVVLADKKCSIVLFRGTNNLDEHRDVRCDGHPTGWHTNLNREGVGRDAFFKRQVELQSWVQEALGEGRQVVVTGHSLGGALAARLMASFGHDEQQNMRLITFSAAGIESAIAEAIRPERATAIWHAADPVVTLSGEAHPKGFGLEIGNAVDTTDLINQTHGTPFLALMEGWGHELLYREKPQAQQFRHFGEQQRQVLARLNEQVPPNFRFY